MSIVNLGITTANLSAILLGSFFVAVAVIIALLYERISAKYGFILHTPGVSTYAVFYDNLPNRVKLYLGITAFVVGLVIGTVLLLAGSIVSSVISFLISALGLAFTLKKFLLASSKLVPEEEMDLWSD
ncbi:MAG: hypothetical protein QXJ48_04055 [Candidatus Korarchaeum sp.]